MNDVEKVYFLDLDRDFRYNTGCHLVAINSSEIDLLIHDIYKNYDEFTPINIQVDLENGDVSFDIFNKNNGLSDPMLFKIKTYVKV